MPISIADSATIVSDRLHLATDQSSVPPTPAMIQQDLRDGARHLFNTLRPVFLSDVELNASLIGAIENKGVILHVETDLTPLYIGEWSETAAGVLVTGYRWVRPTETVHVWHTKKVTVASDASSIDADCIHGADWIWSAMIHYAIMQAELRMSNSGDVAEHQNHLSRYRVIERMWEQEQNQLRAARESDIASLQQRLQQRQIFGAGVWRESALSGFENEAEIANHTTGSN